MPVNDIRLPDDDVYKQVPHLIGGLDISKSVENIDPSQAADLDNVYFFEQHLRSESGYKTFADTVVGAPRRVYKFQLANGSIEYLLITNTTFYKYVAGQWQYVNDGTSTTLSNNEATSATVLEVADTTGFSANDRVGITLNDGTQHKTTIASVSAGVSITVDDGLPSAADSGNAVQKAVDLLGVDSIQISAVTVPSEDWVVFTNGVDAIKKYNGSSVTDLGGLNAVNVDTCRTIEIYNNVMFLGFTTESGTKIPYRIRNCDVAAFETWNSGVAGIRDLLDTSEFIVRLALLGPYLIAYRKKSVVRGEWIGDADNLVNWNTTITGRGVVSHDGVVDVGDFHVVIDTNDLYAYHGGLDIDTLIEEIFYKLFGISTEIAPAFIERVFGAYVNGLREVFIFWPDADDEYPTRIARYNLFTGKWSIRTFSEEISGFGEFLADAGKVWSELDGTWLQQQTSWTSQTVLATSPSILLCGKADLQVFEYDYLNTTDDGTGIAWRWASKNFFHPRLQLTVDFFEILAKGGTLTVEYSFDRGRTWRQYGTLSLSSEAAQKRITKQITSNQVSWRFSGTGPGFELYWFGFKYEFVSPLY